MIPVHVHTLADRERLLDPHHLLHPGLAEPPLTGEPGGLKPYVQRGVSLAIYRAVASSMPLGRRTFPALAALLRLDA